MQKWKLIPQWQGINTHCKLKSPNVCLVLLRGTDELSESDLTEQLEQ